MFISIIFAGEHKKNFIRDKKGGLIKNGKYEESRFHRRTW